jgi:hypothetical protein
VTRRRTLPGAEELFRTTGGPAAAAAAAVLEAPRPAAVALASVPELPARPPAGVVRAPVRRRGSAEERRPSGRERHDEKITVYVSPEELLALEQARLTLRADHGLAVDRGRLVREALSLVLAELDAQGESSTLVRRLRGR